MTTGNVDNSALEWAIRDSLVSYVRAMKDGAVAVRLPADEVAGGFRFPGAAELSPDGSLRFTGCVRLSGHSGMLNLQFEDPWLVPGASPLDPWSLTIADPYAPGERMVFAMVAQVVPGVAGEGCVGGAGDGGGASTTDDSTIGAVNATHRAAGAETSTTTIVATSGTTLTEDGADLFFSGPYLPGTELDNPRVVTLD